jgi:hypothetical protein
MFLSIALELRSQVHHVEDHGLLAVVESFHQDLSFPGGLTMLRSDIELDPPAAEPRIFNGVDECGVRNRVNHIRLGDAAF